MKFLSQLVENQTNYQITKSIENNVRLINESELLINHGKDLDNLLYKFKLYTNQSLYNQNQLNESNNNYVFTTSESKVANDMLIYICEEYRAQLLLELNMYDQFITTGQLILNEGLWDNVKSIADRVKQTWALGKQKVSQAISDIKTKLKAVNEVIRKFAAKAIKTVKEMTAYLIALLDKFNCTLKGLFEKMGLDTDKEEKSVDAIGAELAKNPDDKTKELVKKIDPEAIDDDGNIVDDKVEPIVYKLADYSLARYKNRRSKKKKGLWARLKSFVKGLFGGNKKEGRYYNDLVNYIDESLVNEAYDINFIDECFETVSLKDYIKMKMQ